MIRLILITTFILGLFSCKSSSDKMTELQKENNELHHEIDSLKAQTGEYTYMPIVYPKSSRIKIGEKYEAVFLIGVYCNKQKPTVTVHDQRYPLNVDTLIYNTEGRGCFFTTIPKSKGHYIYVANMSIPTLKDTVRFPIKWEFDVE